jgi:hypothetical protein
MRDGLQSEKSFVSMSSIGFAYLTHDIEEASVCCFHPAYWRFLSGPLKVEYLMAHRRSWQRLCDSDTGEKADLFFHGAASRANRFSCSVIRSAISVVGTVTECERPRVAKTAF